jgi:hypothetical protein
MNVSWSLLATMRLERFHPEWKRSSSYFASNFIGLESLRVSSQADIALEQIPFAPEHANG